ncbi:MAG: hypothetical protein JW810_08865 [Sedimentisphaerales bacterium]|nr:hypothetical protein [Sedimentisphaerales bacterium]
MTQDALNLWAELWSELEGKDKSNGPNLAASEKEFIPSCGIPKFLEKMWLLKHYLDFIKRYSQ